MAEFSERGNAPTDFERQLVARMTHAANDVALSDSSAAWLSLASRIGLDALLIVMDEFGTEKISVPTRNGFLADLWRPLRDAEVLRLLGNGERASVIGAALGITAENVRQISARTRVTREFGKRAR